jgi:hypothetical protein
MMRIVDRILVFTGSGAEVYRKSGHGVAARGQSSP